MAPAIVDEKQGLPAPLTVMTTSLSQQTSQDSINSHTLTPSAEKRGLSTDIPRTSEASGPYSAGANPFDTDIEAIISHPASDQTRRKSTHCARGSQVWPGQDHWRRKAKAAKMKRSCSCLAHLEPRTRLVVKILIGFLIIGIAVGVGVGISKPLGAGIWHPKDGST